MKNIKVYYFYLFIATITRNIIDIYSVVYLYQKAFFLKDILYIYLIVYFLGAFISKLSLNIGNIIGYKYLLITSSILTSLAFYIINRSQNMYLIAIFLSLSTFTYHPIKHYYGLQFLKQKKAVGKSLILIYIAVLISSFFAIKNIKLIYLLFISIVGVIPAMFIKKSNPENIKNKIIISKHRFNFFIFDQFKILFIMFESLYLYLLIGNISYVGTFNIILTISSIICIYFLSTKINFEKHYCYFNLIFTLILLLKISIMNEYLLLIIALLEGIGIKMNELVSNMNLYHQNNLSKEYIITCEKIFCFTRTIILAIFYLLPIDLKIILYILLCGIFILSFQYKKNTT